MTKTVSLKELRPQLPQIMDDIGEKMNRYVVTRHGHPAAVILSPDDLEGLLETLEIMQDKKLMRRIRRAEKDFKAGRTYSLEEVRRSLKRV